MSESARRIVARVLLLLLGFTLGFFAAPRSSPGGPLRVGDAVGITYPTGRTVPAVDGGDPVAVTRRVNLRVYRTGGAPVSDPPVGREIWVIGFGGVDYYAVAP